MTQLTKWMSLGLLVWLGGCAYPAQQMVEVPTLPADTTAEATPDPVCDDPVERAESAKFVSTDVEDLICALSAKMSASQ